LAVLDRNQAYPFILAALLPRWQIQHQVPSSCHLSRLSLASLTTRATSSLLRAPATKFHLLSHPCFCSLKEFFGESSTTPSNTLICSTSTTKICWPAYDASVGAGTSPLAPTCLSGNDLSFLAPWDLCDRKASSHAFKCGSIELVPQSQHHEPLRLSVASRIVFETAGEKSLFFEYLVLLARWARLDIKGTVLE
jgi:hypothetical protein